jgi:hypothetical protein
MKNRTKDPSALLKLQAKVLRQTLSDLCRKEGRTVLATLRVAFHLVQKEDVQGKPPRSCTKAIEQAKEIRRLEHKAEEPDWPESARLRYQENQANNEKFFPQWTVNTDPESSGECLEERRDEGTD